MSILETMSLFSKSWGRITLRSYSKVRYHISFQYPRNKRFNFLTFLRLIVVIYLLIYLQPWKNDTLSYNYELYYKISMSMTEPSYRYRIMILSFSSKFHRTFYTTTKHLSLSGGHRDMCMDRKILFPSFTFIRPLLIRKTNEYRNTI